MSPSLFTSMFRCLEVIKTRSLKVGTSSHGRHKGITVFLEVDEWKLWFVLYEFGIADVIAHRVTSEGHAKFGHFLKVIIRAIRDSAYENILVSSIEQNITIWGVRQVLELKLVKVCILQLFRMVSLVPQEIQLLHVDDAIVILIDDPKLLVDYLPVSCGLVVKC